MIKMKNYGIILASGTGTRFGGDTPKQFVKLAGKTVLEHTLDIFEKSATIDNIIVVILPEYRHVLEDILLKNSYKKIIKILNGGTTRKESSCIGVSSITDAEANVFIHDCARPFLSQKIIKDCFDALKNYSAIDVAIPATDTIIQIDDDKNIVQIPNRKYMYQGQTPQCFKLSIIRKAHELAHQDDNFTDDCGLVLKYNLAPVHVIDGDIQNIKITHSEDIFFADKLFQIRTTNTNEHTALNALQGKVIVVFGGSKGIGESIVKQAAKNGANVYSFATSTGCDIADYDSVSNALKDVFDKEQKIDFVINTAGVLKIGKLEDRTLDDIKNEININYFGSINVCRAAIPYLKKTSGMILLFASSSYTRGRALYSTYSSTKAGIVNLTQALAEELSADNIKINVISPARTATPMRFAAFGKEPEGTLLSPDKVALTSLETCLGTLTGQVIDVRN